MGQSNSNGAGSRNVGSNSTMYGARTTSIPDDRIDDDIKMFDTHDNNKIKPAQHPISTLPTYVRFKSGASDGSTDKRNCNSVGFGLTFAKKYKSYDRKTPGAKIMIASCGYGGTGFGIPSKSRPYWWNVNDQTVTFRNDDLTIIERGVAKSLYLITKDKLNKLKKNIHPNSKVVAILWHQGENDIGMSFQQIQNNPYITAINNLFRTLRTDIKVMFPRSSNNVPILLGGLCPDTYKNDNGTYQNENDNGFKRMTTFIKDHVVPSIPNAHFVSAEPIRYSSYTRYLEGDKGISGPDQTVNDNNHTIHFSADSLREFGKRYYSVFSRIT